MYMPITFPGFEGQHLSIQTAGFFRGARVLHNGDPIRRRKGSYLIRSNSGEEVPIRLKTRFLDPIPQVIFRDMTLLLERPLTWYEYVWIGVPILLVFTGGALGALIGLAATYSSTRIFRSTQGKLAKYGATALISVFAIACYAALAIVARHWIGQARH